MKKKNNYRIVQFAFFVLLIGIFSSCNIEKRLYNSGYFITTKGQNSFVKSIKDKADYRINENDNIIASTSAKIDPMIIKKDLLINGEIFELLNLRIPYKYKEKIKSKYTENSSFNSYDSCATIYLKNGELVDAIVIEISTEEIKYKKCEKVNGPTYIIKAKEVNKIIYSDGTTDHIKSDVDDSELKIDENTNYLKPHPSAIRGGALAALILGFIIFSGGFVVLLFFNWIIGLIILLVGLLILIIGAANLRKRTPKEKTNDVINLKNGKEIEGTIIENKPGKYVKIQTLDYNFSVYKWSDIESLSKIKQ